MALTFDPLWRAYTDLLEEYPDGHPCDQGWSNQCAIRMSIVLQSGGISFKNYTEPRCKHGHARGAESLAGWLWKAHLGRPKIYSDPAAGKERLKASQGLIFFKNCFTRDWETARTGDHIDLWNKILFLLCHLPWLCDVWLEAAWAARQGSGEADDEVPADGADRVWHVPFRPDRRRRAAGSLRVAQVPRAAGG